MTNSNDDIDAFILSVVNDDWQKIAMVISRVFENSSFEREDNSAQLIAERIYILIDNGKIKVIGNMRRWRNSEISLS